MRYMQFTDERPGCMLAVYLWFMVRYPEIFSLPPEAQKLFADGLPLLRQLRKHEFYDQFMREHLKDKGPIIQTMRKQPTP